MKKKREQQKKKQHDKMKKQNLTSVHALEVTPGAIIVVKCDSHDITHALGIPRIAWMVGNGGGLRIMTQLNTVKGT
jgi:hypothetical protein